MDHQVLLEAQLPDTYWDGGQLELVYFLHVKSILGLLPVVLA